MSTVIKDTAIAVPHLCAVCIMFTLWSSVMLCSTVWLTNTN